MSKLKGTDNFNQDSDNRFYAVTESATDAIITINSEGIVVMWNKAAEEMFGYLREEAVGKNLEMIVPSKFWKLHSQGVKRVVDTGKTKIIGKTIEVIGKRKNGEEFFVELSLSSWQGNKELYFTGIIRDITEKKLIEDAIKQTTVQLEHSVKQQNLELIEANKKLSIELQMRRKAEDELENSLKELKATQQQLFDIIDFLPDATFVVDKNRKVIAWNKAIEKMTGIKSKDILYRGDYAYSLPFYGTPRPILIDLILEDSEEIRSQYDFIEKRGNIFYSETFVPQAFEGKGAFLWATASPLFSKDGEIVGAIEAIRDVTQRKKMENQLKYLATHDPLTNVPNRYSLEDNLKRTVGSAKRGKQSALLMIDLDNFKIVNDSLGHIAGDEILITFVNLIKSNLRESDLLFRIGGDEFAIILEDTDIEKAKEIAEKLRLVIEQEELCLAYIKQCFNLTISIGLVVINGNLCPQKLLSYADSALYMAKDVGRNKVILIDAKQDLTDNLAETNIMVGTIKKALVNNDFVLYFQPVIRNDDGVINHYEVLLRIKDDRGNLVMPNTFIPVAERFGLMPQIDLWVVKACFGILKSYPDINLMVNLSGASFGDQDLLDYIEKEIKEQKIVPSRIGFEITETNAVKDIIHAERWISRIRKLGCTFALDDFGIGFSSFSYLRMLPAEYIKIDGSFVRDLDQDSTHRALVEAISNVAKALGKKAIAEYVESREILDELKKLGVEFSQGYYISKPKLITDIVNIQPYPKTS